MKNKQPKPSQAKPIKPSLPKQVVHCDHDAGPYGACLHCGVKATTAKSATLGATPTPWVVLSESYNDKRTFFVMSGGQRLFTLHGKNAEQECNFIVRAVNAHDELVEALEELVAEFDEEDKQKQLEPGCGGINPTGGMVLAKMVLEKLAKAEGK